MKGQAASLPLTVCAIGKQALSKMSYKCIVGPYGTHGRMYIWSNNDNNRYKGVVVIDGRRFKTRICYSATEAIEAVDELIIE